MRLREIQALLQSHPVAFKPDEVIAGAANTADGKPTHQFNRMEDYRKALRDFLGVPVLAPTARRILESPTLGIENDSFRIIADNEANSVVQTIRSLAVIVELLRSLVDGLIADPDTTTTM